jgi:Catalase
MMHKASNGARKSVQIGEQKVMRGEGGETHQIAGGDVPPLTTQQGVPVADDQNYLKIGSRGPTLLEDFHFREKIFHFDHERIPERIVHARGFGSHGFFENNESLATITRADLFQRAGEKTPASSGFRLWQAIKALPISYATSVALPSSSTQRRATGTSSETTFPCSSSKMRSSFPTLRNGSAAWPCLKEIGQVRCGTFSAQKTSCVPKGSAAMAYKPTIRGQI